MGHYNWYKYSWASEGIDQPGFLFMITDQQTLLEAYMQRLKRTGMGMAENKNLTVCTCR